MTLILRTAIVLLALFVGASTVQSAAPEQPSQKTVLRLGWPKDLDTKARLVSSEIRFTATEIPGGGRIVEWYLTFQEPRGVVKLVIVSTDRLAVSREYAVIEMSP